MKQEMDQRFVAAVASIMEWCSAVLILTVDLNSFICKEHMCDFRYPVQCGFVEGTTPVRAASIDVRTSVQKSL